MFSGCSVDFQRNIMKYTLISGKYQIIIAMKMNV